MAPIAVWLSASFPDVGYVEVRHWKAKFGPTEYHPIPENDVLWWMSAQRIADMPGFFPREIDYPSVSVISMVVHRVSNNCSIGLLCVIKNCQGLRFHRPSDIHFRSTMRPMPCPPRAWFEVVRC